MHKANQNSKIVVISSVLIMAALVLGACGGGATEAPTQDPAMIQTQAAQTVVADLTLNAPVPTEAPVTAATPTLAPPPGPTPDPNLPVAVVPTPAPGEPGAIADYNTTIYGGPGDDYVVYGAFLGSQAARVVGVSEDGLWWAIGVPVAPMGSGWVDAAWVTVSNADSVPVLPTPPVPPTTELVPPGPNDPQATALANTFVRTGPATNFPAYGIALAGANGRVIGRSEDGGWWVVRLNPEFVGVGYGWVSAQYTQAVNIADIQVIENPETYASVPPSPPPAGAPSATAVEYVNVRTGPGTNYPVLGVASPGASAEVSGVSADSAWWQVKIPAQVDASGFAWVSASYVIAQNTEGVPVVDTPAAPPVVGATPPPLTGSGCTLAFQDPADGLSFGPGTPFNTTWALENSGTTMWDQAEVDIRFVGAASGVQLHQGSDVNDLAATVQPGATYNFTVSMIAPFDPGIYGEVWEVVQGSQPVCQFYVYIEVP